MERTTKNSGDKSSASTLICKDPICLVIGILRTSHNDTPCSCSGESGRSRNRPDSDTIKPRSDDFRYLRELPNHATAEPHAAGYTTDRTVGNRSRRNDERPICNTPSCDKNRCTGDQGLRRNKSATTQLTRNRADTPFPYLKELQTPLQTLRSETYFPNRSGRTDSHRGISLS